LQLSPLWRGPCPLFVQTSIPFMQRWFVPCLIEIGLQVLEKKIFSNINTCKNVFPHLYNSESPLPKDDLCQLWLKLAQWFWRRSRKCKSLTDRQMMDDQKSSLELSISTQVS
jgi:hypothetical protein